MIIPFLLFWGVKAYWAYAAYVVVFWMIGFFGFFFLLHRIYNDSRIAWAGTSLLMFSGCLAVFFSWQMQTLYIFAPTAWFFGFLVGFVRSCDDPALKKNMFGLSFSSMFLVHLYIPFYFLTLFFVFIVSVLLFAREWFIQFLRQSKRVFKKTPWAMLFCLASVLLASWPTVDCYLKMKDPQNIVNFYRGEDKYNAMVVSQRVIAIGGLPCRATFSELFSSFETGDQYLSFVPLVLFILALLTLFNRSSRAQRVIFMTGFLLLLIAITNASPLEPFLYKYLYFFRLFRNYFLFWILFWSCCVVYVMGEAKQFLEWNLVSLRSRILYATWVVLAHAGVIIYLMSLEDVPAVSYGTVIASCCWFLARLLKVLRVRAGLVMIGLVFIGLWQPFYVLPFIKGIDRSQLDYPDTEAAFSYVRPLFGHEYNGRKAITDREKFFQDDSGFVQSGYIGQRCSYLLEQNLSKETLADYVRHKFILYGQTRVIHENNIDWEAVRGVVTFKDPFALIWDESGLALPDGGELSLPIILKGPSPDFKVVGFDVNSITLDIRLGQRKFLVYNDSFHPGWHVLVDDHPAKLYQANIAFKGVWIEKGSHLVKFYFGSWVDYLRGWSVSLLFIFWFFLVITMFLPSLKERHDRSNI
jgi:hypothetical protein